MVAADGLPVQRVAVQGGEVDRFHQNRCFEEIAFGRRLCIKMRDIHNVVPTSGIIARHNVGIPDIPADFVLIPGAAVLDTPEKCPLPVLVPIQFHDRYEAKLRESSDQDRTWPSDEHDGIFHLFGVDPQVIDSVGGDRLRPYVPFGFIPAPTSSKQEAPEEQ